MKDVRTLLDNAVDHNNTAHALAIGGKPEAVAYFIAAQAQAMLAIALLLERRERRAITNDAKPPATPAAP